MKVYALKVVYGFDADPPTNPMSFRDVFTLGIYESREEAENAIARASKIREQYDDRDYYGGDFMLYNIEEVELNKDNFDVLKVHA